MDIFQISYLFLLKFNLFFSIESTLLIVIPIVALILGFLIGYVIRIVIYDRSLKKAGRDADSIREKARSEAEEKTRELIRDGKKEVLDFKNEIEKEYNKREEYISSLENKLNQREENLDNRIKLVDQRENVLSAREEKNDVIRQELDHKALELEAIKEEQEAKLIDIAGLSREEAKEIVLREVKEASEEEIYRFLKEEEDKARFTAKEKAKNIISLAIQKYAAETSSDHSISSVNLPSDDLKGRIIGREGRNIRTIEALTGVDVIIDDTPDVIVLSSFDAIRRTIAKNALESLITDGRIHPARIEEVVDRERQEIEMLIRKKGEEAIFNTGIGRVHPDLIKIIGRLHFRTSYGQNVLAHSIETAHIAGKLAVELGEDEILARRAGLFHDIGKAIDHEVEGSHVDIGIQVCEKYHEPFEVIDAIASHHEEVPPKSIIAVLVAAADALSSSRPGARSDSLENYIKRLEALEKISNSIPGVKSSYAIRAGREVRVIVDPLEVNDYQTDQIAKEIKTQIEDTLSYPGTVKVTVIREKRAVDIAK